METDHHENDNENENNDNDQMQMNRYQTQPIQRQSMQPRGNYGQHISNGIYK